MVQPRILIASLEHQISRVIVGKEDAIQLALIALICRGHVLIEDVPGVGKTTLASALARSLNCSFRRIQFTPDRKSTRLNSSHPTTSRMPSSA